MFRLLVPLIFLPVMLFSQEEKKDLTEKKDPTEEEVKAAYDSLHKVDGQVEFAEVVQLDTAYKKDNLYRNAKLFFANISKSSKEILQYDDREEGKVIGKGTIHLNGHQNILLTEFTEDRTVNYTLEVSCKDGKYKYRMFGFSSDYAYAQIDKRKLDHMNNGSLTMEQAYQRSEKGGTKKMERVLFMATLNEIKLIQEKLKEFMRQTPSKDDF